MLWTASHTVLSVYKWLVGDVISYSKIWRQNADFQSIFARNASAVTASEKS